MITTKLNLKYTEVHILKLKGLLNKNYHISKIEKAGIIHKIFILLYRLVVIHEKKEDLPEMS